MATKSLASVVLKEKLSCETVMALIMEGGGAGRKDEHKSEN